MKMLNKTNNKNKDQEIVQGNAELKRNFESEQEVKNNG